MGQVFIGLCGENGKRNPMKKIDEKMKKRACREKGCKSPFSAFLAL